MRIFLSLLLVFSLSVGVVSLTSCKKAPETAAVAMETEQKKCPVMGNDIDKRFYVDYKGKRIYFCCGSCIEEFNKEPEKYMKKLEGIKLPDAPKS